MHFSFHLFQYISTMTRNKTIMKQVKQVEINILVLSISISTWLVDCSFY